MASLKSFLKAEPVPAVLKVETEEGDERRVKMGTSRSRIRDAELACKGAVRVEALDAEGDTLRVWESEEHATHEAGQAVKAAAPPAAGMTGQEAMMTTIARLLVEAGDSAASRQVDVMQLAFSQQAALMGMMSERLAQLERVWQETLMHRAEELDEEAEALANTPPPAGEAPSQSEQLVTTLLQGAVMSHLAGGNAAPSGGKS